MATNLETQAMRQAIALSAHGLGTTSPNPPVGCVILDPAGVAVGAGYHRRKGEPHAERLALDEAGDRAAGGTAIVTLEPCNHVGRTPACHQGLLDAGIRRVVVALIDPTSRREGGVALLRDAGVDVEVGVLADEARLVIGPWLDSLERGRPTLTAVVAGDDTRAPARAERAGYDAVILESGSVEEGIPAGHGFGVLTLPVVDLDTDPVAALNALYAGGVRTVLVEATAERMAILQRARLLDTVVLLYAAHHPVDLPDGLTITRVDRRADMIRIVLKPQ